MLRILYIKKISKQISPTDTIYCFVWLTLFFLFKKINNIEKRFKSFYKNIIPVGIIKKSTLIENNKIFFIKKKKLKVN